MKTMALAEEIAHEFGQVRLLINNAGIEVLGRGWKIPPDNWEQIMRVNIAGPVNMVRAFLPSMAESDEQGYIANICSIGSLISIPIQGAYIASMEVARASKNRTGHSQRSPGTPRPANRPP